MLGSFLNAQEPVQVSAAYTIRPMDALSFRIVGEPETVTEVRVASDGTVSLPYIGNIEIAGKTVQAVREELFRLYDADYFVNPQINLLMIHYAERRVQVLGFVARQGFVPIPPEEELDLLGAISGAGGWVQLSKKSAVSLKRTLPDGTTREFRIDAEDLSPGDWPLQDGDVIFVPERIF